MTSRATAGNEAQTHGYNPWHHMKGIQRHLRIEGKILPKKRLLPTLLMLVPRQAGGDVTHYEVDEDLRIAYRSDEIYGQLERKIDGEWRATGVQVASIHDTQNNVTGFSGLTEEEVANLESPNSYPVADRIDPSSSYPANEPIDASPGGYQPYDGDKGQVLDNPMPEPDEIAPPNTEYPAESGWQSPQVMMSEGTESNDGNRVFEPNPKHGKTQRGRANPEPSNPEQALEASIELPGNTTRRIAVDKSTGEFVVFDEHLPGKFHGHTRTWSELDQVMQTTLRKEGLASKKGKIK